MILFPNAKINIGLRVVSRRPDGYHDIQSIFVPIPWCDVLEIVPANKSEGSFNIVGEDILKLEKPGDNLVMKALQALESYLGFILPPLDIYLSKRIPTGAGLGGGSADASFALKGVNEMLSLGLAQTELASIAARVGADCPFFIYNRPMFVEGIGDIMTPVDIPSLDNHWVVAAKIPGTEVSTRDAYAGVTPDNSRDADLRNMIIGQPETWRKSGLSNDFEKSVFDKQPRVRQLKEWFESTQPDCVYSSMSGSGSTVYAVFNSQSYAYKCAEVLRKQFYGTDIFTGRLSTGTLN